MPSKKKREKLLTISVAAYNMEKYIEQNLSSMIIPEIIDDLEVFIIDDGGTDRTMEIVQHFVERYPETFFPVHKENGGYGTTVNYSIAHATGKYFKLLDGDDWFDQEGLKALVYHLHEAKSDIIVTNIYKGPNALTLESKIVQDLPNGIIQIKNIEKSLPLLNMWYLCFRLDLLRSSSISLPSHSLYTDQIYSLIPFATAKTIEYLACCVYCYRIGRSGQSISRESRIKHTKDALNGCLYMCRFYDITNKTKGSNMYILRRVAAYYLTAIKTLCLPKPNYNTLRELKEFDQDVKKICTEIYSYAGKEKSKVGIFTRLLRHTNYMAYWLLCLLPRDVHNWD